MKVVELGPGLKKKRFLMKKQIVIVILYFSFSLLEYDKKIFLFSLQDE